MNNFARTPASEARQQPLLLPPANHDARQPPPSGPAGRRWLIGLVALLLFSSALGSGVWRHYAQHRQVIATAEKVVDFVPSVRVEEARFSPSDLRVTLPGTTLAFEQASVYARASGYVAKRYVDIGDHVKSGQLLAEITAPEVEDQIAQYQNNLKQAESTHNQNQAQQSLAQVTWGRDAPLVQEGWVTLQQGDTDRYNLQAQQHARRRLSTVPQRCRPSCATPTNKRAISKWWPRSTA